MTDIVFMDTETLGLHLDAPIWEFAAIRRHPSGEEQTFHCFIDHYPLPWFKGLPEEFQRDYESRYIPAHARTRYEASKIILEATNGAHVIGAVPSFDTVRLSKMLAQTGFQHKAEPWHYHLVDVENIVVGYLAARGRLMAPPWKSDELSAAVGVDPGQFDRHTAMGDVLWVRAQWDAVMQS